MTPHEYELQNSQVLVIRDTEVEDSVAILEYVESISGESDFLSFGPGEFHRTEPEEEAFIGKLLSADNSLFILGLIEDSIVAVLTFSAGDRPRVRH